MRSIGVGVGICWLLSAILREDSACSIGAGDDVSRSRGSRVNNGDSDKEAPLVKSTMLAGESFAFCDDCSSASLELDRVACRAACRGPACQISAILAGEATDGDRLLSRCVVER